ncbi:MAG: MBL fold metallo-hydrolase [Proteobacteria bacterium]|nr:MBL fold metallo-hydrolase [Pseudomonadota bacterium]
MKAMSLSKHLTWLEPATMSNFSGCGGLLIDGRVRVGIDTNFGTETAAWLAAAKPDVLIASHYHIDHVATLKHGEDAGVCRLLIPAAELHMVRTPENFHHLVDREDELLAFWKDLLLRHRFWPSGPVDGFVAGDIEALDAGLVAIPTPGHSPGHTSFLVPDEGILFSGDMGIDSFGPWYCWPDCDLRTLVASLIRLRDLGAKTLLTSHGPMVTGETACRQAFDKAIEVIRQREDRIATMKEQDIPDEEIVSQGLLYPGHLSYKTEFRHIMGYWEEKTLQQHLAALAAGGVFGDRH